jgi:soluble lytic murein transglycosylase-like protein
MTDFMYCRIPVCLAMTLACAATALPAQAEIVHLSSGRTLSVKGHRVDGDRIVLTLRGGGDVNIDRTLVEKIVPDEVPYPEAETVVAAEALDQSPPVLETPYAELIASISEAHGVDPNLVRALIQVESGYRPRARSPKRAKGLMQLMPSTAREFQVRDPYDP